MFKFALVALLFVASSVFADCYCMIFSHDSKVIPLPYRSHVWGTFVSVKDNKVTEEFTISWSPRGGWNCLDKPKEGFNMSLIQSVEDAVNTNKKICMWGPFRIEDSFYRKAKEQYEKEGYYKCIDLTSRRRTKYAQAVNCIHRLTDIVGEKRLITHVRYGKCAGQMIYNHYNDFGLLKEKNEKVFGLLKLEDYPIVKMK